ncbi:hypothetical protein HHK36_025424 [Tetracentron sinense]|uniref:Myb-like domain-containing protein n=1 Tax=Tetracentron sinense TaxID=13715 RepID=A0A835D6D4_TETSI|nr:hypothetical protein HHK36_025424 [Tetracentron sinense]
MGRSPCCSKEGMNRGAWTTIEDRILADYIKIHGEGRWRNLPKKAASTLSRKNSNQSNNKKKPELIRPPSPKMESRVVRTKALRCTKPFVTPQPDIGPSMVRELVNNKAVEAESCDGVSSVTPLEDHSSDFMMDLNMGELFLSNFLDNDLSQLCDFNNSIVGVGSNDNRSNDDFSPSTDQPFLFSDEMLENWTGNDSVQQDFDMDLQSFLGVYS